MPALAISHEASGHGPFPSSCGTESWRLMFLLGAVINSNGELLTRTPATNELWT